MATESYINDLQERGRYLNENVLQDICNLKMNGEYYQQNGEIEGALISYSSCASMINTLINIKENLYPNSEVVGPSLAADSSDSESNAGKIKVDMEALYEKLKAIFSTVLSRVEQLQEELKKQKQTYKANNDDDDNVDWEKACIKINPLVFDKGSSNCVFFNDLAGLKTQKKMIKDSLISPLIYPNLFPKVGKGFLLYGPPGTGKTFIVKAAVNQLQFEDQDVSVLFFPMTGAELKGKYVGETEKRIKEAYMCASQKACDCDRNTGKKNIAIIFIDEIDSIAGDRGSDETGLMSNSVNTLLQMMDGIQTPENVATIGATNYPWDLDAAVLRRFDTQILLGLPESNQIVEKMNIYFDKFIKLKRQVWSVCDKNFSLKKLQELKDAACVAQPPSNKCLDYTQRAANKKNSGEDDDADDELACSNQCEYNSSKKGGNLRSDPPYSFFSYSYPMNENQNILMAIADEMAHETKSFSYSDVDKVMQRAASLTATTALDGVFYNPNINIPNSLNAEEHKDLMEPFYLSIINKPLYFGKQINIMLKQYYSLLSRFIGIDFSEDPLTENRVVDNEIGDKLTALSEFLDYFYIKDIPKRTHIVKDKKTYINRKLLIDIDPELIIEDPNITDIFIYCQIEKLSILYGGGGDEKIHESTINCLNHQSETDRKKMLIKCKKDSKKSSKAVEIIATVDRKLIVNNVTNSGALQNASIIDGEYVLKLLHGDLIKYISSGIYCIPVLRNDLDIVLRSTNSDRFTTFMDKIIPYNSYYNFEPKVLKNVIQLRTRYLEGDIKTLSELISTTEEYLDLELKRLKPEEIISIFKQKCSHIPFGADWPEEETCKSLINNYIQDKEGITSLNMLFNKLEEQCQRAMEFNEKNFSPERVEKMDPLQLEFFLGEQGVEVSAREQGYASDVLREKLLSITQKDHTPLPDHIQYKSLSDSINELLAAVPLYSDEPFVEPHRESKERLQFLFNPGRGTDLFSKSYEEKKALDYDLIQQVLYEKPTLSNYNTNDLDKFFKDNFEKIKPLYVNPLFNDFVKSLDNVLYYTLFREEVESRIKRSLQGLVIPLKLTKPQCATEYKWNCPASLYITTFEDKIRSFLDLVGEDIDPTKNDGKDSDPKDQLLTEKKKTFLISGFKMILKYLDVLHAAAIGKGRQDQEKVRSAWVAGQEAGRSPQRVFQSHEELTEESVRWGDGDTDEEKEKRQQETSEFDYIKFIEIFSKLYRKVQTIFTNLPKEESELDDKIKEYQEAEKYGDDRLANLTPYHEETLELQAKGLGETLISRPGLIIDFLKHEELYDNDGLANTQFFNDIIDDRESSLNNITLVTMLYEAELDISNPNYKGVLKQRDIGSGFLNKMAKLYQEYFSSSTKLTQKTSFLKAINKLNPDVVLVTYIARLAKSVGILSDKGDKAYWHNIDRKYSFLPSSNIFDRNESMSDEEFRRVQSVNTESDEPKKENQDLGEEGQRHRNYIQGAASALAASAYTIGASAPFLFPISLGVLVLVSVYNIYKATQEADEKYTYGVNDAYTKGLTIRLLKLGFVSVLGGVAGLAMGTAGSAIGGWLEGGAISELAVGGGSGMNYLWTTTLTIISYPVLGASFGTWLAALGAIYVGVSMIRRCMGYDETSNLNHALASDLGIIGCAPIVLDAKTLKLMQKHLDALLTVGNRTAPIREVQLQAYVRQIYTKTKITDLSIFVPQDPTDGFNNYEDPLENPDADQELIKNINKKKTDNKKMIKIIDILPNNIAVAANEQPTSFDPSLGKQLVDYNNNRIKFLEERAKQKNK